MHRRPRGQRGNEPRIPLAKLAHEPVDVPQVAQPPLQIAIGEEVRGGVDHHVLVRQHEQPVPQRHGVRDQRRRIGRRPRSGGPRRRVPVR